MVSSLQTGAGSTNIQIFGSLLFLLFILVPGYVALRSFHFFHISIDDRSRWDKLAVIIIGGLTSLVIAVLVHVVNVPSLGAYSASSLFNIICHIFNFAADLVHEAANIPSDPPRLSTINYNYIRNGDVNFRSVANLGLISGSAVILFQSVVATLLGYLYGVYRRRHEENPQMREELADPWERVYQVSKPGAEVVVVTDQNRMIKGEIQQMGSPSKEYDVLLVDPKEVKKRSGTEIIEEPLGEYSYHNQQDISRIEFIDPEDSWDPDSLTQGNRSIIEEVSERFQTFCDAVLFDMIGMEEDGEGETSVPEDPEGRVNVEIEQDDS